MVLPLSMKGKDDLDDSVQLKSGVRTMSYKIRALLVAMCLLWVSCRTADSHPASNQQVIAVKNEHASHSEKAPSDAGAPVTHDMQSAPLLEAKQAYNRRLQNEYMCPNGWKEQRKYASYTIKEHDAFLHDVQNLDEERVVLEVRAAWSQRCLFDGGWGSESSCSGPIINKPLLVVPVDPPQHGFSVLNLVLENLDDMKQSQLAECYTQDKYENHPIVRFVLDLDVSTELSYKNELVVNVNAVIQ